ncbi:MAG TPA: preprotein translocase subunit SecE [Methylomirabilota bacterium]|nr:preprotein translocase subunit SecE [Methylomirabilota bacterium]
MADKPDSQAKRVVKNPETFRERASKAAGESDKPKRLAQVKQASSKATKPVSQASSRVASSKLAKPFRKPAKLVGRVLLPRYVRKSWQELKQVTWPTRRESVRLTVAVLIFAAIFGATIALVDYGLDKLFKDILLS